MESLPVVAAILGGGVLLALWFLSEPWRAGRRRRRSLGTPTPAHWQRLIERHVPVYRRMPPELHAPLYDRMKLFLDEKQFYGCNGLTVTEAMRVAVAAHAALLVLRREPPHYPDLQAILLYPEAFIVRHAEVDAAGVVDDSERVLAGESWSTGRVVLSWADMLQAVRHPGEGRNVALHEFAHQLDAETGAPGVPALADAAAYRAWSKAFSDAFARLRQRVARHGSTGVIDAYGATSPAEFFAVSVEAFWESPGALRTEEPALYALLSNYFQIDPAAWIGK